jgi:16S rRNA G966 N2-methylase RsmD
MLVKREYTDEQRQNHIFRMLSTTDSQIKKQFQYDEVALDSITHFDIADDITKNIIETLNSYKGDKPYITILDAFACVGGNTISFCKHGMIVSAIELNEERFKMLSHNIELFSHRATLYNTDAVKFLIKKVISGDRFDAIFIDVPWDNIIDGVLYVGEYSLMFIVELCLDSIIVLKLPVDYQLGELAKINKVKIISVDIYDEPNKMAIITIIHSSLVAKKISLKDYVF